MTAPGGRDDLAFRVGADDQGALLLLKELADALRNVERRGEQTGKKLESTFDNATRAAQSLVGILGARQLVRFAGDVLQAAEAVGELSEKTGVSAETLSTLAFAGRQSGVSLQDLDATLGAFANTLQRLEQGETGARNVFRQLGLSAEDLQGLSPEQALLQTIDALSRVPAGFDKAALAQDLFGRSGRQLIPVINDIASKGLPELQRQTDRAGQLMTTEGIRAAREFQDQLDALKASVQGTAFEFLRTLLPSLTRTTEGMQAFLRDTPEGMRNVAAAVTTAAAAVISLAAALKGIQLLNLTALLRNPAFIGAVGVGLLFLNKLQQDAADAERLATAVALTADRVNQIFDGLTAENRPQRLQQVAAMLQQAQEELAAVNREIELIEETQRKALEAATRSRTEQIPKLEGTERLQALRRQQEILQSVSTLLTSGLARLQQARPGAAPELLPSDEELKARAEALRAAAQRELAIARERQKAVASHNERDFAQGLRTLDDYWNTRLDLARQGTAAEIAALEAERRALSQTPTAKPEDAIHLRSRLADIDAKIQQARIRGAAEEAQLQAERSEAERELAEQLLDFELQLRQARGDTHAKNLADIAELAEAFDRALFQRGVTDAEERGRRVQELVDALTAQEQVQRLQTEAAQVLAELDQERQRINDALLTGQLSQLGAENAIAAAEQARLPRLREIAAQTLLMAQALGDPSLIASAEQLSSTIESLAANADIARRRAAEFKNELRGAVEGGIVDLLTTNLTDPLQAVRSLLNNISQIFAQRLAQSLTELIFGAGTLTTSAAALGGSAAQLQAAGGTLLAAAAALSVAAAQATAASVSKAIGIFHSGGPVLGAGEVPIIAQAGEFVFTRRAVTGAGGFQAMAQLQADLEGYRHRRLLSPVRAFARAHDGGPIVGGAETSLGTEVFLRGEFALDQGLVLRQLETDRGQQALFRFVKRNADAVRAILEDR